MKQDLSDVAIDLYAVSRQIDEHHELFQKRYPDIHSQLRAGSVTPPTSISVLLIKELSSYKIFSVMRRIQVIYTLLLFIIPLGLTGQNMDSIKRLLNTGDLSLTEKERISWDLVEEFSWTDAKYTMGLLEDLRLMPAVMEDSAAIMKVIRYEGKTQRAVGNYANSLIKYQEHYDYHNRLGDTLMMALSAGQIGIINLFRGDMTIAQNYLLKSHDYYSAKGSPSEIAGANNSLASFYADMGQTEKAVKRYELALEAYTEARDTNGMANVHANTALILIEKKEFDEAERHLRLQGKYDTILGTNWGLGFHHDFMGYLYREQGRYEEAMASYKVALKIREGEQSHYNIDESRVSLANMLLKLGRPGEAISQASRIFDNREKQQSLSHLQSANEILAKAYEETGQFQKALLHHKDFKSVSDSIYNKDHIAEITENDAKFNKVEQDKEIAILSSEKAASAKVLRQKNKTIIMGSIGFAFISILSFLLYRVLRKVNNQKGKLAEALTEKELLIKEIHHRVKNNLQLVSSLLSMQSRTIADPSVATAIEEGKSRVRSMALIHQDLYQNENLNGVNLSSYLDDLTKELFNTYKVDSQQVKLELDIQSLELDVDSIIPLGLILNELITNSLKYAFPNGRKGTLSVSLKQHGEELALEVSDDGVGYDVDVANGRKTFGTKLIDALSRQMEGKISVDNRDGTKVSIRFKNYETV